MSSKLEDQRAGYCRHCGERLPLIKRVKREEFCSEEHREHFLSSTQIVALDRLRETDPESQPEPQPAAVAVAIAEAEAEPDPPMAGTLGPVALNSALRLITFFDGGDESSRASWEPVRPEPQWQNLALCFDLAEFSAVAPEAVDEQPQSHSLRDIAEQYPASPLPELALPRGASQIVAEVEPDEPDEAFDLIEDVDDSAPAPLYEAFFAGQQPIHLGGMEARPAASLAESVEIDTTLYLPAFSPTATMASLGLHGWDAADWIDLEPGAPVPDKASRARTIDAGEPLTAAIAEELPLQTGCELIPAEWAMESVSEPEPELPAEVLAAEPLATLDELEWADSTDATPTEETGATTPLKRKVWEERGMSEALQSTAPRQNVDAALRALGERVANPFLHDPQPRPGSGKPRWVPVTVTLGTNTDLATEDWDIL